MTQGLLLSCWLLVYVNPQNLLIRRGPMQKLCIPFTSLTIHTTSLYPLRALTSSQNSSFVRQSFLRFIQVQALSVTKASEIARIGGSVVASGHGGVRSRQYDGASVRYRTDRLWNYTHNSNSCYFLFQEFFLSTPELRMSCLPWRSRVAVCVVGRRCVL